MCFPAPMYTLYIHKYILRVGSNLSHSHIWDSLRNCPDIILSIEIDVKAQLWHPT